MKQLNLFTDNKECVYCGNGGSKPGNPSLWNGFQDQDTGDLVCFQCKEVHYISKAQRMGTLEIKAGKKRLYRITGMTYSEIPVSV